MASGIGVRRYLPGRPRQSLRDRSILLVVSTFDAARDIRQALQHAGAHVIAPCNDHERTLRSFVEIDLTCAILGFDLQDGVHAEVAKTIQQKRVPIILLSSEFSRVIPDDFSGCPILYTPVDLYSLLKILVAISVSGEAKKFRRLHTADSLP
jgi:hypothetical protein